MELRAGLDALPPPAHPVNKHAAQPWGEGLIQPPQSPFASLTLVRLLPALCDFTAFRDRRSCLRDNGFVPSKTASIASLPPFAANGPPQSSFLQAQASPCHHSLRKDLPNPPFYRPNLAHVTIRCARNSPILRSIEPSQPMLPHPRPSAPAAGAESA